jgi:membrane fusion protein (multidrug efflux system)
MRLRAALDSGLLKRAPGNHAASVRLVMEDGSEYAQSGRLLFSDVTVDPSSGQVTTGGVQGATDARIFVND